MRYEIQRPLPNLQILSLKFYASIAEDSVEEQSLEASFAMKVSPVVPPGI